MKTPTLLVAAAVLGASAWSVSTLFTQTAVSATAAAPMDYSVSVNNRFHFFYQSGRLVKLDTLTGDFTLLDQLDGSWNPVIIPTREANNGDENSRNINFLWQNLTNANLARLSNPARSGGRFRYINVYFNPDGISLAPPPDPAENAQGSGVANPNYFNRLVRFDAVTGEFALMDTESATFVRVAIPVKNVGPDVNSDNVRLISGLRL